MKAAIQALRQRHPAEIVVAVPVAPAQACREMADLADRAVCLLQPTMFGGVGEWYLDFRQTSDGAVRSLLEAAQTDRRRASLVGGGN
jgi:putative phosphoribosyl transferase